MAVINSIAARHDEMTEWRRDFHMHPELGFEEHRTSDIVAGKLESWGIEVTRGLAGTGVVGTLRGSAPGERVVGLRADMDCLPIHEENDLPWRSQHDGKMHACGHDGHTTMLLGAARYLAETRNFAGTVHFIFQPAEETLIGGKRMIDDGLFERFPCDEVYGLHNAFAIPTGQIGVMPGRMMAAGDWFDLKVTGKGAHGAMPHLGIDPVYVAAQIVVAWQGLVSRMANPLEQAVISVTRFQSGTTYNVIPETAELSGTVRTFDPELRNRIESGMGEIARGVASGYGASADLDYMRRAPATVNHAAQSQVAIEAAARVVGRENVLTDQPPTMASEDFGWMLEARPGCYIWLGQAGGPSDKPVHNSKYEFNDAILPLGASYFASLVEGRLAR